MDPRPVLSSECRLPVSRDVGGPAPWLVAVTGALHLCLAAGPSPQIPAVRSVAPCAGRGRWVGRAGKDSGAAGRGWGLSAHLQPLPTTCSDGFPPCSGSLHIRHGLTHLRGPRTPREDWVGSSLLRLSTWPAWSAVGGPAASGKPVGEILAVITIICIVTAKSNFVLGFSSCYTALLSLFCN